MKNIKKTLSIFLVSIIMVFSFLPVEKGNYAYEPVFQQHFDNDDPTVAFLTLNKVSVNVFQNGFYFINQFFDDSNSYYSIRNGFKLQELFTVGTFIRNSFYTYISIHAP